MSDPLLALDGVTLSYDTPRGPLRALDCVDLALAAGETLAVVGESGSGKSTVALSVMGLLGPEAALSGSIRFDGEELIGLDAESRRKMRGRSIGMVFQDPFTSLNPSLKIGDQVAEPLMYHFGLSPADAHKRALKALAEVGLPDPGALASAYPHQLSGGMQQRVLIANAVVCDPHLLILDEPTTALDVTVEARILDLLDQMRHERDLGTLFITHNLGVVNRIADRVCVLYAGRVVETGSKDQVLGDPAHPYTKGLMASLPTLDPSAARARISPIPGRFPDLTNPPPGCVFADRCPFAEEQCRATHQELVSLGDGRSVRCWKAAETGDWPKATITSSAKHLPPETTDQPLLRVSGLNKRFARGRLAGGISWRRAFGVVPWPTVATETVVAVDDISLDIRYREVLGLVGESGSGKSTLGRVILRLLEPSSGTIRYDGDDIAERPANDLADLRQRAQIVFQNPDSSLNPRRKVGDAIVRAMALQTNIEPAKRRDAAETLLDRVGLPRDYYDRYPHQMSGGEKQRVGIARALATNPDFIVCDEPVSALDVSVQATVLNLLEDLRDELKLSYLFISHDMSVVSHIADRIAVMYSGHICETGPTEAVLKPPYHPYTEALLSAVPLPKPGATRRERIRLRGDRPPSAAERSGCPFHTRCPRALGAICESEAPPVVEAAPGHTIACHIPLADLADMPPAFPTGSDAGRDTGSPISLSE